MASLRQNCETRLAGMKTIRQDYEDEAREVSKLAMPARSRFLKDRTSNTQKRRLQNKRLLDAHGIGAFRTLAHGMTSGLSSASRPWFQLKLADEDLADSPAVREWLADVERRMYGFLAKTNFYSAAKTGYHELGLFGTEACISTPHDDVGAVFHALTFGEYWVALGTSLTPDTLYRECTMTVRQAVQQFKGAVSARVRNAYDQSNYNDIVNVFHAIEPNLKHDPENPLSRPYHSIYWDMDDQRDTILRNEGQFEQPFWAPRWDTCSGDVYGFSPAMEALPDLRELQMQVRRRNEAIDHMVKPEKVVPAGLQLTNQPGSVVSGNSLTQDQVIIPYQMPYQAVGAISQEIERCRRSIDALSFAELFNAITNMQGIQPRNMEEIASRNEEKLTQLGPVIERVGNEKLEVAIDRVFGMMSRGGLLPPPPEELQGMALNVEFVSILTQMQRMVGIGQIERTVGFIGNMAGAYPDAADKLNVDAVIDEYAYRAGTPSNLIRSAKEIEEIRAQRAQAQQQQQMMEAMPAIQKGADAARLLSEADTGGGQSLLQQVMPA